MVNLQKWIWLLFFGGGVFVLQLNKRHRMEVEGLREDKTVQLVFSCQHLRYSQARLFFIFFLDTLLYK